MLNQATVTANAADTRGSRRVLEPIERISEVLFGIIMVMTFTGSLSVAEAGREDVRTMLITALGCNFAWGIIDAIMYLMACLSEQSGNIRKLLAVRRAADPQAAHRVIVAALPRAVAQALESAELEKIRLRLVSLDEPPARPRLSGRDWLGATGVFLLVTLSTLPVILPFALIQQTSRAMRLSNAIALLMLFLTGAAFGRCAGYGAWRAGVAMVLLGAALVGITIALGG